jgi:signal transduction histidine kinase
LRLAILYGCVFLVSGTVLLAIAYTGGTSSSSTSVVANGRHGFLVSPEGGSAVPSEATGPATPQQERAQEKQVGAVVGHLHDSYRNRLLIWSGVALAIMALASMALGWTLAGRALRPLQAITSAARAISASNLHARLALGGPRDEVRELGDTFDELLGRLEASFEAQRQFVANASHELRTPLTLERAILEVTLADPAASAASLRTACERVLAIGEQQERMIGALLTLARSERGIERREPLLLDDVMREVLDDRREEIARRRLRVDSMLGHAATTGDRLLIERLVANLLDNAIQHNDALGWVAVTTATEAGRAVVTVSNSGPVIPAQDVERLLRPFNRLGTDRTNQGYGHGLGLSIVDAIATAHGATLTVRPQDAGGLCAEVTFATMHGPAGTQEAPSSSGGELLEHA